MSRGRVASRTPVIDVRREIRGAIIAAARQAAPRECCGLLIGHDEEVLSTVPVPNRARGAARYRVDPRMHLEWQRLLRETTPRLEVVGAYHSHPAGPARPSARDVAEAHDPRWIHVIVGLGGRGRRVGAFRIAEGTIERLDIRWR